MSKEQDRIVHKVPGQGWANLRIGAERPEKIYPTQNDAIAAARINLIHAGGGELTIQGENGRFRDKNTIAPGSDPYPPKG